MKERDAVELFHLIFIAQLTKQVDPKLIGLKGGSNLRFYFRSIRYSEDIDFDVQKIAVHTLRNNVTKLLETKAVTDTLLSRGITISSITAPKQTEVTQRWKIALRLEALGRSIPTRVEFSRRSETMHTVIEPISAEITARHALYPIHAFHYGAEQAFQQKVEALIGRSETQARDVFDLDLLIPALASRRPRLSLSDRERASEAVQSLSFDDFQGQVVAYLLTDYQTQYRSESLWNQMSERVCRFIEELR